MNNQNFKIGITDVVLMVLSVTYLILLFTVFTPCGLKDDGSFMKCQWAWRAVVVLSVNIAVFSLGRLISQNIGAKIGFSISMIVTSITSILIPYKIIGLCMMNTMRCHTHTKPGVYVFSILIIIFSVIDLLVEIRKLKNA